MEKDTLVDCVRACLAAGSLLLVSCGSSGSGNAAWDAATTASYQNLRPAVSTASVKVPVLKSEAFEAKWGKPRLEVNGAGGYRLSYSDPNEPFNRLVIYGVTKPWPALSSPPKASFSAMVNGELGEEMRAQSWRTVVVAGKTVRFFQESGPGGADGAYYSTEGFALTDADGKTGYYRLVVEGGADEGVVRRRFASAQF